ncbi:hypothetical protein SESBI_08137 [Sesbania bispinosa]|nr:hypothetical protein SESBI_08137 [Sesbania bispinosa]
MALLPTKRLLLLAFLLLCFISITARARNLRETKDGSSEVSVEKGQGNLFKPKPNQGGEQDIDDLATMDYTPAKKNPPIHN